MHKTKMSFPENWHEMLPNELGYTRGGNADGEKNNNKGGGNSDTGGGASLPEPPQFPPPPPISG